MEGAGRRKRLEGVGDLEDGEKEGGEGGKGGEGGVRQNRWQMTDNDTKACSK